MATINLGNIKFQWQGTYNAGTTYAVDDVVAYNGSSYVCILASTGNLPTNTTYWNVMSQAGTDGTDVGTTLTTQGDMLYRDGSGLQRLAKGTAGYYLKQGTNHPEWSAVASDCVKLASVNNDNVNASYYDFQSAFNESTYQNYKLIWTITATTSADPKLTYLDSSNAELTGSQDYARAGHQAYRKYTDNSSNTDEAWSDAVGTNSIQMSGWNQNADANQVQSGIVEFNLPKPSVASLHQSAKTFAWGYSTGSWMFVSHSGTLYTGNNAITGFRVKVPSGNITKFYATLYGFKK